ncbi:MAG: hypothetical protein [Microviridae sp.]|nr:MAG: hypothetical protein [Microviridae sp.]
MVTTNAPCLRTIQTTTQTKTTRHSQQRTFNQRLPAIKHQATLANRFTASQCLRRHRIALASKAWTHRIEADHEWPPSGQNIEKTG